MPDKIFGIDFTNDTNPLSTWTISVHNGTTLVDVALGDLYKALSIQSMLDTIGATQGMVLYYNGTDWVALSPGTSGQLLKTLGAGANPAWALPSDLLIASQAQGDILYFNGTNWVRLPAGTAGKFLKTLGAGANPAWDTVAASTLDTVPGGRLTLTTGVPVTTSDVASSTNVYYTPYIHDVVTVWDGSAWVARTFTELTLAIGTVTAGIGFDVFLYDNAGALAIEKLAWTSATARATAISLQDGRYCKTGDKTRLYVGSFYSTSTTQTADSVTKRFLWNMYNRTVRSLYVLNGSAHNYNTATIRAFNNDQANSDVEWFSGLVEDAMTLTVNGQITRDADDGNPRISVGLNSTTVETGSLTGLAFTVLAGRIRGGGGVPVFPVLGYNFACILEFTSAGTGGPNFEAAELSTTVRA